MKTTLILLGFLLVAPSAVASSNGDSNGDGAVTIGDVFYLINHLFAGGPPPINLSDANGDTVVSSADIFYLVNYLFAGGAPPLPGSGRYLLPVRGLYTQIERRGWASEYWTGQLIRQLNDFDAVVGSTVGAEAAQQLDAMHSMGVNAITLELRTADAVDGPFAPPACTINPALGLAWPQPTQLELANLAAFLDLVQQRQMKIYLRLVNTHMEEQPPTNSQRWLGAILGAIKDHPAFDLVTFDGDVHVKSDGTCGIPAEPPLWMGPGDQVAQYVKWAVGYARSLGIPTRKLSAEALIGSYATESEPPNSSATDGHLWSPIRCLKQILDDLSIPDAQRTYAVSFFEQRRCADAQGLTCTDEPEHQWAEETLQKVRTVVGSGGNRIVATELGYYAPVDAAWKTEWALESLNALMPKYNLDGGTFWRWVAFDNNEEADPTRAQPVKRRGVAFAYNPVVNEVIDLGGFHVYSIENGSFELGSVTPASWSIAGEGTGTRYDLTAEAGQPEVPSRGTYALQLVTGSSANAVISATSTESAVSSGTAYTLVINLRFGWTGDPNPGGSSDTRPNVFIRIRYLDSAAAPVASHPEDVFRFVQENATAGFDTFPVQFTTPANTAKVRVEVGAERNSLPSPITLFADNIR